MSTICVTHHNEDIHKIIKQPSPPIIKSPMYISKRNKYKAEKDGTLSYHHKKELLGHQTLGLAHYDPPDAANYLKRKPDHQAQAFIDKKEFGCTLTSTLPPLPKWKIEFPKISRKNFVKENIKWVGSLEPKAPCPRKVVSPRGTVKDLRHQIEIIKCREREDYGKVPEYLCARKKKVKTYLDNKKRQLEIERAYQEQMGIGTNGMAENLYMIDKETREKLLQGLKEYWNELSKQFLKLPVMCDTMTKIRRKAWLEKEIDKVEKDVRLVESHPYIYLERTDKKSISEIAGEILKEQEKKKKNSEEKKEKEEAEKEKTVEKLDDAKEDGQELGINNHNPES